MTQEFPVDYLNEIICLNDEFNSKCKFFDTLKLINKSFNGISFFVLNIIIDLFLLKYFNKDIGEKIRLRNHNADNSDLMKKNTNRMILSNGIIQIVSHLPEFLVTVLLLVFRRKISDFCGYLLSCDILNEEAQSFDFNCI